MSIPAHLLDPELIEYIRANASPEELAELDRQFGRMLKEQLQEAERLSLQPKQDLAEKLCETADELLFGGAAGGGKSHWLLIHVIKQMRMYPGNRGVVFRRVFPSLERTLIPRARAMLAGWAEYNGQRRSFTFPNGSVLEFGSLQYEADVIDYQGAEYGVIAFEEVTEFLPGQLDFMKSRLRAPVDGPRPHLIATTNPGGVGHAWVKRRYVRPKPEDYELVAPPEPFEVWRPAPTDADPEPLTRCFVPATLRDNPKLVERDPDYVRRLRSMANTGLRKALEDGDWDAIEKVEGAQWAQSQLDYKRVRTLPAKSEFSLIVVGVDPSGGKGKANDEQGIVGVGKTFSGKGFVMGDKSCKLPVNGWARQAVQFAIDIDADEIAVEDNFGGDMAVDPLQRAAADLGWEGRIVKVHASRGKRVRAEPVANLYGSPDDPSTWDEAVMHHYGDLEDLEQEMKSWLADSGSSPNHMDAMVWAATRAMLGAESDYDIDLTPDESITSDLLTQQW